MGDGRGERGCMEEMGDGCGALARTPHAGGRRDRGKASRPRRGGWEIAAGRDARVVTRAENGGVSGGARLCLWLVRPALRWCAVVKTSAWMLSPRRGVRRGGVVSGTREADAPPALSLPEAIALSLPEALAESKLQTHAWQVLRGNRIPYMHRLQQKKLTPAS